MRTALALAALSAVVGASTGCEPPPPPERHRVTVEVRSDVIPLEGVELSIANRVVARTDATGTAQLDLPGREGTVVPVTVRCPRETRSPSEPLAIPLRSVQILDPAAAARGIVRRVDCPPTDRTLAVVVRARGWGGLPVLWQGREVTRTDATGLAHVTFRVRPATQLALTLGTEARPALRPQNPTRPFVVGDADAVLVWDQDFVGGGPPSTTPARPRAHRRPVVHRVHRGPTRIRLP